MKKENRLFIVANRLPVQISGEKEEATIKPSSGGLVSALKAYLYQGSHSFSEICWAGVPGCTASTWHEVETQVSDPLFNYLPVMVYKEQYDSYYNGFSNAVLWPLFHYFPSFAEYCQGDFDDFMQVNEHFAEVLTRNCRENDTIWIHDYHLLPLAAMLRKALPKVSIGFFLHIPFPSIEIFRMLPRKWQEEILKGMLGADLIGFHTMDYASHFLQSVQLSLGVQQERNIIRYKDRLIKVDVFPISVDYASFNSAFDAPGVVAKRELLHRKMDGRKIIFSVDRLDYTKGVYSRLLAYEHFLRENPVYRNEVVFNMVVVPSRDNIQKYAERKRIIDETVSRINGELGNLHWQPVNYQYNVMEFEEMVALYTACDLALITPLRDGMNLVSKEFVASRRDQKGVLVLSEMAGSSRELTDALIINPNDTAEVAAAIRQGLEMNEEEQWQRMEKMQSRIASYDVTVWAEDFLKGLDSIKQKQKSIREMFLDDYAKITLLDAYRNAEQRLLFLDYDGTLVPFSASPEMAIPGQRLKKLLEELGHVPGNQVFVISGRSSLFLEEHFGELPLHLIAEHGARVKRKGREWQTEVQPSREWKGQVLQAMEMFARRCAHTFVEEKDFSIVWHYRNADRTQGKMRAIELTGELHKLLLDRNLEVINGNRIVEVRNRGVDKGVAIRNVLENEMYDFIFAVGDDKTDEDMFKTLAGRKNCFTVKVGPDASYAQYNLLKPQMVRALLENMRYISVLPAI